MPDKAPEKEQERPFRETTRMEQEDDAPKTMRREKPGQVRPIKESTPLGK